MNALDSLGSVVGLMVVAMPAAVIVALGMRGSGGILLRPIEVYLATAYLIVGAVLRAVHGSITLDDPFVAPLLVAIPYVTGFVLGARVAVVSAVCGWWLLGIACFGNPAASSGTILAPLLAAVGAAVFGALYAPLAARARGLRYAPVVLVAAPVVAKGSGLWLDPTILLGMVATVGWVVALDATCVHLGWNQSMEPGRDVR